MTKPLPLSVEQLVAQQQALVAELELRNFILNQAPALIGYWDNQLINQFSNDAYSRWFGLHPEEIKGKHLNQLLGDETYNDLLTKIEGVLNGKAQRFERYFNDFNTGQTIHTLTTYIPNLVNDQVKGFYVLGVDISDQDRLQDSEIQKRTILENLDKGVVLTDSDNRIIFINPAFEKMTGYTLAELKGKNFELLQGPNTDIEDINKIKAALATKQPYKCELVCYRKNGAVFLNKIKLVPIANNSGQLCQFVYFLRDISFERQQQEHMALLSSCVAAMSECVVICDASNIDLPGPRIVYVNDGFCKVTGYSREEVMGNTPRLLQGPNTDRASLDKIRHALKRWQPIDINVLNYTKSGEEFWQNLKIFPIANSKGWYTHWVSIQRDISLVKQQELALKEAKEQAEQLALIKSQFLANMSHEIRTPLSGVIGLSTLALDCTDLAEIKQFIKKINNSSLALLAILNDILDLSKIQDQGFSLNQQAFVVKDLLASLNDLFVIKAWELGLSFYLVCDPLVPKYLYGDDLRLRQVLVNLLGNAFKFTEQGLVSMYISVIEPQSIKPNTVKLKFSILDTGIGLSKEQMTTIFERFSQADTSTARKFEGSGLGLTISQELIRAMGGDIQVISKVGKGSEFSFELEFECGCKAVPKAAILASNSNEVLQGKLVLLVDDDNINLLVTGLMLKKIGVEYDIAENGAMALERIKSKSYDLVLMDIQMPVMDGLQATKAIRKLADYKTLPILAMSAGVMLEEKQACTKAGMDGFIAKPVSIEKISTEFFKFLENLTQ